MWQNLDSFMHRGEFWSLPDAVNRQSLQVSVFWIVYTVFTSCTESLRSVKDASGSVVRSGFHGLKSSVCVYLSIPVLEGFLYHFLINYCVVSNNLKFYFRIITCAATSELCVQSTFAPISYSFGD